MQAAFFMTIKFLKDCVIFEIISLIKIKSK